MKRQLIIYLTDGQTIERDLTDFIREMQRPTVPHDQRLPMNPPADHQTFINALLGPLCMMGTTMPGATKDQVTWVPPSQIKSIQIKFEGTTLTVN